MNCLIFDDVYSIAKEARAQVITLYQRLRQAIIDKAIILHKEEIYNNDVFSQCSTEWIKIGSPDIWSRLFFETIPVIYPIELEPVMSFKLTDLPKDSSFAQYMDLAGRRGFLIKFVTE